MVVSSIFRDVTDTPSEGEENRGEEIVQCPVGDKVVENGSEDLVRVFGEFEISRLG